VESKWNKLITQINQLQGTQKSDIITSCPKTRLAEKSIVIRKVAQVLNCVHWHIGENTHKWCRYDKSVKQVAVWNPTCYSDWLTQMKYEYIPTIENYEELRNNKDIPKMIATREWTKKTLILDLDETLVHSSFNSNVESQIEIPLEINGYTWNVFVQVRPGAKYFLEQLCRTYEVVIFTASISEYANPLMNKLDPKGMCKYRLFREHCSVCNGVFVKDLMFLGREPKDMIIIDNSPNSYAFQNDNALPIQSWYNDASDTELYKLLPILHKLTTVSDVRIFIPRIVNQNKVDFKKGYKLLKIDYDYTQDADEHFGSSKDLEISEFEEQPRKKVRSIFLSVLDLQSITHFI